MSRSRDIGLKDVSAVVLVLVALTVIGLAWGWSSQAFTIDRSDATVAATPVVQRHGSTYAIVDVSRARGSDLQRDSEGRPMGAVPGGFCSGLGLGRLTGRPFQLCLPREVWVVHAQGKPGEPALTTQDDLYVFVDAHTGQVISWMESGPL